MTDESKTATPSNTIQTSREEKLQALRLWGVVDAMRQEAGDPTMSVGMAVGRFLRRTEGDGPERR